jgi:hypothetical protein
MRLTVVFQKPSNSTTEPISIYNPFAHGLGKTREALAENALSDNSNGLGERLMTPTTNAHFFPEAPPYVAISNAVAKKPPFTSSKIKAPQPSPLHEF